MEWDQIIQGHCVRVHSGCSKACLIATKTTSVNGPLQILIPGSIVYGLWSTTPLMLSPVLGTGARNEGHRLVDIQS